MMRIRKTVAGDLAAMVAIINEAATAYRGVIPPDLWKDPYMPAGELEAEIADGIAFWGAEDDGHLAGVMGIQDKGDVALIRHAYVRPAGQRGGIGTRLLRHVSSLASKPLLVGTWAAASWAIDFYRRNRFVLLPERDKDLLLERYWSISRRQAETSVVLADPRWIAGRDTGAAPDR